MNFYRSSPVKYAIPTGVTMRFTAKLSFGMLVIAALLGAATVTNMLLGFDAVQAALLCLPVVICAVISWLFTLRGRTNSTIRSFIIGAFSGLVGTLIWPSGWMIWEFTWYARDNMNHCEMCGLAVMLIATLIALSMAIGAAITTILMAIFYRRS